MRAIILALTIMLAPTLALGGKRTTRHPLRDPKAFFVNLHPICSAKKEQAWPAKLSKRKRKEGPAYVSRHYRAWCPEILKVVNRELGGKSQRARVKRKITDRTRRPARGTLVVTNLKHFKIIVAIEAGRLVIDEN